jgi:hypothetical protein
MKRSEVAQLVVLLQAAYPNFTMSEGTTSVYESLLHDVEFATAKAAVERLICTNRFMPTIAEIRETCVLVKHGSKRTGAEAWGDVGIAIRKFGSYRQPKFEDQAVAQAVKCLGWRNLCLGSSNESADRARFCEIYDSITRRERENEALPPSLQAAPAVRELPNGAGAHASVGELLAKIGRDSTEEDA